MDKTLFKSLTTISIIILTKLLHAWVLMTVLLESVHDKYSLGKLLNKLKVNNLPTLVMTPCSFAHIAHSV